MKNNNLIGIREAETRTGKSRQYIYRLIKEKRIKKHTENGIVKVDFLELYNYISTTHYGKKQENE